MTDKVKGPRGGLNALEWLFLAAMLGALGWVILGDCIAVIALLGWLAIGCLCFCPRLELPGKAVALGIFLFSLMTRLAVIILIEPPPVSDFGLLLDASRQLAAGDYSFQDAAYFNYWPGQTGQVILQGWLLRVWDDIFILKLANALAGAGTDLLIYLTARLWFGGRAGSAAALFHCLAVFPLTLTAVLTNQIIGGFFTYLALYLLVSPKPESGPRVLVLLHENRLRYPLAGALTALANIVRPDGLVMLVAVGAYCVFGLFGQRDRAGLRRFGMGLVTFLGAYLFVFQGASWLVAACGVNSKGLSSGDITLKLVYGFDLSSGGGYSNAANEKISALTGQGISRESAKLQVLKEELRSMGLFDYITLFERKQTALWKGSGLGWALGHLREARPFVYQCAVKYNSFTSQWSLLLGLIGFTALWLKKKPRPDALLPAFIVFAGFSAYLMLEVQPRYVYGLQPALFILAAGGIEALAGLFGGLFSRSARSLSQG